MSFYRNLICFSRAIWLNCPNATFAAENKMAQLRQAVTSGFLIPDTVVTNTYDVLRHNTEYAIKALDTTVLSFGDKEGFVYTSQVDQEYLAGVDLSLAPVVAQNYLRDKVDLRVTVIGNVVHAVKIMVDGKGVDGDWRLKKAHVDYVPVSLPPEVERKCVDVVREMGLLFAGVDLALVDNEYVFIELNPTGEWAWLVEAASLDIFIDICDCLEGYQCV